MGIPTELVGSLPRPAALQKAYADYDAGSISKEEFVKAQDEAVKDSLSRLAATGEGSDLRWRTAGQLFRYLSDHGHPSWHRLGRWVGC